MLIKFIYLCIWNALDLSCLHVCKYRQIPISGDQLNLIINQLINLSLYPKRGLFFIYRRQDLFISVYFRCRCRLAVCRLGLSGAGAFGRKEGGACRLPGVSGASRVLRGLRGEFCSGRRMKQRDSCRRNPVK